MAQLDSTIFTMEQQRMMLEQANVQVDTIDAMKMGQKAMKAALQLDRELVTIMQTRDRGELAEAQAAIHELVARNPNSIAAHLLYQEMAAVARRNV